MSVHVAVYFDPARWSEQVWLEIAERFLDDSGWTLAYKVAAEHVDFTEPEGWCEVGPGATPAPHRSCYVGELPPTQQALVLLNRGTRDLSVDSELDWPLEARAALDDRRAYIDLQFLSRGQQNIDLGLALANELAEVLDGLVHDDVGETLTTADGTTYELSDGNAHIDDDDGEEDEHEASDDDDDDGERAEDEEPSSESVHLDPGPGLGPVTYVLECEREIDPDALADRLATFCGDLHFWDQSGRPWRTLDFADEKTGLGIHFEIVQRKKLPFYLRATFRLAVVESKRTLERAHAIRQIGVRAMTSIPAEIGAKVIDVEA